jgi:hypothetical protein
MSEADKLVEQALFLGMYGERPPGADPRKPEAETWADWYRRAEQYLRSLPAHIDGADSRH